MLWCSALRGHHMGNFARGVVTWARWRRAGVKRPPEGNQGHMRASRSQLTCSWTWRLPPEDGSPPKPFPSVVVAAGLPFAFSNAGQGYGCVRGASLPISSHASPRLNLFLRLCSPNRWHYSNVNIFREFVPSPSRDLCFDRVMRFFPFWMVKSESATPSKEQQ